MVVSYRSLPKRVIKAHARTSANYAWVQENWGWISKDYATQFIAVADHEVVFNTSVYMDFLNYLSGHQEQADLIGVRVRPDNHVLLL